MAEKDANRPFWQNTAPALVHPQWKGDDSADAVIVGAGITGITAAYLLAKNGRMPIVLEQSRVCDGDTSRTSAHLTAVPDIRFSELVKRLGEARAQVVADSHRAAISMMETLIHNESIDCDFERVPAYFYTETDEGMSVLEDEFDVLRRLGFEPRFSTHLALPFAIKAAIEIPNQARLHPLRYCLGVMRAAGRMGARFYENSPVTSIDHEARWRAKTPRGTISSENILIGTYSPLGLNFLQTKVAAYRSYCVAARVKGVPFDGLYWDTEEPYHYTRTYQRGEDWFVIVGGSDHKTGAEDPTKAIADLESYLRYRYVVDRIEYRWSGQIMETMDGLPMIGPIETPRGVQVATGFSGNGLSFGTLAAMIWNAEVVSGKSGWSDLYSPSRLPSLSRLTWYVNENKDYPMHFVADRISSNPELQQIEAGTGSVVKIDGEHVAAYRDSHGKLHLRSAVCPHMGCLVRWNGFEMSWDCPCHGSRFSKTGSMINGPTTCDLKPVGEIEQKKDLTGT